MNDPELRTHLDLAASDDSWMVYIARKSGDRIRVFRKSHKFPHADFNAVLQSIKEDMGTELLNVSAEAANAGDGQGLGKGVDSPQ